MGSKPEVKEQYLRIKDKTHLKKLCKSKTTEFFILLNFGVRSVKWIRYNIQTKKFDITNLIDNTYQNLTAKELDDKGLTNIGRAIKKGALYTVVKS